MFAESQEPEFSAEPISPIALRAAYLSAFEAFGAAQPHGDQVRMVDEAACIIARSDAPLATCIMKHAGYYKRYWEETHAAYEVPPPERTSTGNDLLVKHGPAEAILTPFIQSYVFSGLAVDGRVVLQAAEAFGKDLKWVKEQVDISEWEFTEKRDLDRDWTRRDLKRLEQSATASYEAAQNPYQRIR